MPFVVVAVALAIALVYAATATAAPREPDREPDDGPNDEPTSLAPARFKIEAEAIGGPFPVGALLKVIKGESGFKTGIVVADKVTGASELGATQLVVEHAADGTPDMSSRSGAIGADVDPLTLRGAIWGAQWVYNKARGLYTSDMREDGIDVPPDSDVATWTIVMHSQHSIGRFAFRKLMQGARAVGKRTVADVLRYWIDDKMPPRIGRMTGVLIRKRLKRMARLPDEGEAYDPAPSQIAQLPERPANVPRFDAAKAKRYILAERRRGTKARLPDGSPPGV
jgi:hypothetical protein